jgi:hypothetical protein
MRIILRGKQWDLQFTRELSRSADGECDEPTTAGKRIAIRSGLSEARTIEVLVHEMLHACHWDLDEQVVTETAHDIARVLYRLGYCRKG